MTTSTPQEHSFLITGASSGLGLAIAWEALNRGYKVVGTARNVSRAKEQTPKFEESGGIWLELDVTKENAAELVSKAVADEQVDVLVNNAGYGLYGVFEDMSEKEIRDQFETNVFGAMRIMQATIPHFREKRRGTLVNMGSISGLTVTTPGGIMYSASKFAIEAISEGLAMQMAPFNVKVLLVEPSFFRTNWLQGGFVTPAKEMTKDYVDGPIDKYLKQYPTMHGKQPGDPERAAKSIIDVVTRAGRGADEEVAKCLRLPLGNDSIKWGNKYFEKLKHEYDVMEPLARSADFDEGPS